jgi:double-GTPase-like protein
MDVNLPIICPVCLESTAVSGAPPRCEYCSAALPPLYLREGRSMLPLPVQFFGLSRHGKSTYLAALTMALQRVNGSWSGFTAMPATESSQRLFREATTYFDTGKLPPPTPPGVKDSYLMLLNHIPKWMKAALTIRDCSGDAFREIDVDLNEATFLLKGPLTFMFISIEDLKDSDGYTMDNLMTSYLNALAMHGARLDREYRKIVAVLTKADLFWDQLPDELLDYMREDPIWIASRKEGKPSRWYSLAEMESYLKEMERISQITEEWICQRAAGRMFVTLARDRNVEIQFSLVSSTGSAPRSQDNQLQTGWEPTRVLDPLLWALELDSRRRQEISRFV